MKAVLPGSPDTFVANADLALAFNGYLAYSSVIDHIRLDPRQCTSITVVPGTLRYHKELGSFQKLTESAYNATSSTPQMYFHQSRISRLEASRGSEYLGIEARIDPSGTEIETLLSANQKVLHLETYFKIVRDGNLLYTTVNWGRSMRAVTFAHHLEGPDMSPIVEEEFARALAQKGTLQKVAWLTPGDMVDRTQTPYLIAMTSTNDLLRFFEAGRWVRDSQDLSREICIRRSAPLIQCLKVVDDLSAMKPPSLVSWIVIG